MISVAAGLKILSWAGLVAFGVRNASAHGAAGMMTEMGAMSTGVFEHFLAGVLHHALMGHKKHQEVDEMAVVWRALHTSVKRSVEQRTESGFFSTSSDLAKYVEKQAKGSRETWTALFSETESVEEIQAVLVGSCVPSLKELEETIRLLYPALEGAVLATVAQDVMASYEHLLLESLAKDDAQETFRRRLFMAVVDMHRDLLAKLEEVHVDVKATRAEVTELHELVLARVVAEPNAPASRQRAVDVYNEGVDALHSERRDDARRLFGEALELDPTFFDALLGITASCYGSSEYDLAMGYVDRALSIRSGDTQALWMRSLVRDKRGDLAGALEDALAAVSRRPDDETYQVRVGHSYAVVDRPDEAEKHFRRAIELNPRSAQALEGLAVARADQGDRETAFMLLDQAISADPTWGRPYMNRGLLKSKQGDVEGAIADLKRSIELNPKEAKALVNLGLIAQDRGDSDAALRYYDEAEAADPTYPDTYNNRGVLLLNQGRNEEAARQFSVSLTISKNGQIYWARGYAHEQIDKLDEAFDDYGEAIRLKPRLGVAYRGRGRILVRAGHYAEAIPELDTALSIEPNDPDAWMDRSKAKLETGDYAGALADIDQAIHQNPSELNYFFRRAIVLEHAGDPAASERQYLDLTSQIDDANVWNNLGAVQLKLRKYEEARASFDRGLKVDPSGRLFFNKSVALSHLGRVDEAVESARQAVADNPAWLDEMRKDPVMERVVNALV